MLFQFPSKFQAEVAWRRFGDIDSETAVRFCRRNKHR